MGSVVPPNVLGKGCWDRYISFKVGLLGFLAKVGETSQRYDNDKDMLESSFITYWLPKYPTVRELLFRVKRKNSWDEQIHFVQLYFHTHEVNIGLTWPPIPGLRLLRWTWFHSSLLHLKQWTMALTLLIRIGNHIQHWSVRTYMLANTSHNAFMYVWLPWTTSQMLVQVA